MLRPNLTLWKKISLAIALLIVARGVLVLCVLPPFEGWDEYQHVAYIVYIKEQRELPRFGRSTVPKSMVPMMQRYPHAPSANIQTAPQGWGTKTYAQYWREPPARHETVARPVTLYEGQQTPLFYLLALPLWSLFSGFGELAAIYALRLVNVLLLAATVFVFLQILEQCIGKLKHRFIIGLLVGFTPMYLINAARVSSDALSIFFGTLCLYFSILSVRGKPFRSLTLASLFLALGILTKATMFIMIPVVVTAIVISAYGRRVNSTIKILAACAAIVILILSPLYLYHSWKSGTFYEMTEVMSSRIQGKSRLWIWSHALDVGWTTRIREWLLARELWFSGWSYIYMPRWIRTPYHCFMYGFWFLFILVGLKRGWGRHSPTRQPERMFEDKRHLAILVSVVLWAFAALAWFATFSLANWRIVMIIPSYFMIALPTWTALTYQAGLFLGSRFVFWFSHGLLGIFVVSELVGTLYLMPTLFTATSWSRLSWERLQQLHPLFPSPLFIIPALVMIAALLIYLLRTLWRIDSITTAQIERRAA